MEVLHLGEEEGCESACYECLLTFYNQRDHEVLDRKLILPFLKRLESLEIESETEDRSARLEDLREQCQSDFEREVLAAISGRDLRLPDEAQKTLYDDGAPIAEADFYYEPRVAVFVDGSPHYKDYVQAADQKKRRRLKRAGFRIEVITSADDLASLERKVS
jgi:hypothetical protein